MLLLKCALNLEHLEKKAEYFLAQQLEAPLPQKQKTFAALFLEFLKCALNLEHLEKKDEYPSRLISRIIGSERYGYLNV